MESKIVLLGFKGHRQFVRRPGNTEFKLQYTVKMVKHGGASIIQWGCFSYYGEGPIYRILGNIDQFEYIRILEEVMFPYTGEEMPGLRYQCQKLVDSMNTDVKQLSETVIMQRNISL